MSLNIDFWTDPHQKNGYGCIVVDKMAERYNMMNGQSLFISRETQRKLHSNYFVTGKPLVDHLEYPLNFECFDGSKAVDNVTHWMYKSTSAANIPKEYFSQISVNGVQCNTIYPGV